MKNLVIVRLENVIVNVRSAEERFEKWLNEQVGMNEIVDDTDRLKSKENSLFKKEETRAVWICNYLNEISKIEREKKEKESELRSTIKNEKKLTERLEKLEQNCKKRIEIRGKKIEEYGRERAELLDKRKELKVKIEENKTRLAQLIAQKEAEKAALSETREAQLRLKWFKEDFEKEFVTKNCSPEVREVLKELGKRRVIIALVTNYRKPLVKPLLERLKMDYEVADGRKENWFDDLLAEFKFERKDAMVVSNSPSDRDLEEIEIVNFTDLLDSLGLSRPKQEPKPRPKKEQNKSGYPDGFLKLVRKGEDLGWKKAFDLLIRAYMNMCGISLGWRTLYYNAAEGWQVKLDGPDSPVPMDKPICDYFPQLCEDYDPAYYDDYDIGIVKGEMLIDIANDIIAENNNPEDIELCAVFCAGMKYYLEVLPI